MRWRQIVWLWIVSLTLKGHCLPPCVPGRLRLLRMLRRLPINFPPLSDASSADCRLLPKVGSAFENRGQPASKVTGAQGCVVMHRHTHASRLVREAASRLMRPRKGHTIKLFLHWAYKRPTWKRTTKTAHMVFLTCDQHNHNVDVTAGFARTLAMWISSIFKTTIRSRTHPPSSSLSAIAPQS